MKLNLTLQRWLKAASLGLALAGSAGVGLAQSTDWYQSFDTAAGPWTSWWGIAPAFSWSSLDASNNASSGSVQFSVPFTGANGEQIMDFAGFHWGWQWDNTTVLDGTLYTNLSFDIKVDPSTALAVNGTDYGQLELGFAPPNWNASALVFVGNYTIPPSATNWTHVVLPIDITKSGLNNICAVYVKMWSNGHMTNTWTVNFDNFRLALIPKSVPPPPPPKLAVESMKPIPGLNLITTPIGGSVYNRYSVYAQDNTVGWVDSGTTVKYSITMAHVPDDPPYGGFQVHTFLVPDNVMPWGPGDTSIDWNATNVIFFAVGRWGADFRYKVNQGSGNSMLWNDNPTNGPVGHLCHVASTNVGTWSLSFANNTNITITTPDGVSTNITMPAADAALFAGSLHFYEGAQANNSANIGQEAVISRIQITGVPSPIDYTFTNLDSSVWGVSAAEPAGVLVVPDSAKYWLGWTLPDLGYNLQIAAGVKGSTWTDVAPPQFLINNRREALITADLLPTASQGYYRLLKRVASRLQILLPGETNAPGTVSGKIGTPDPVTTITPLTVTINATDDTWHICSSSDVIHLTSTDPNVYFPPGGSSADVQLIGGVGTIQNVYLETAPGNWNFTGTSTNGLGSATSATVNVPN